jgi:hypothetical protein
MLIMAVKRKWSSLKFSGGVLLRYPSMQVTNAMMNPAGVAIATDHIALIASKGISGGTSWASVAKAGYASATVNARIIITNVIFFCVVFHLPSAQVWGLVAVGRKEKGEVFGFQAFCLSILIPVS